MAKKSRKTRKEKSEQKAHQFTPWITPKNMAGPKGKENPDVPVRNKPQVPDYVYADFKKISIIMGSFIAVVVILAILSYHTNLFNSFFGIFHIKY